jgi:apolipoprotein N-acyltransferase
VRSSAIFGSYFVTFTVVAVNFCIAIAIIAKKYIKLAAVVAISFFCLNLTLGIAVTLSYSESGEKITVAAAQGNMSSSEKWSNDGSQSAIQIYSKLTEDAAEEGAKIVVWPETALPYVLYEYDDMCDRVSRLAKDNEVTIILSAFTRDDESKEKYNSIIEVKPDGSFGETVYSKQRLVPFGEFVPMREFVTFIFPPLANIGMLEDDLLAGEGSVVIDSEEGMIGCGICFDSIYEKVISDSARNGAEIIVIATNDSWFSDSAALDMHNSQSRLRAIESGKYVVRAANTGISSIIDPMGNVNQELGALERGYIVGEVSMIEGNTIYTHIGNLFVYCCMALVVLVMLFYIFELRRTKIIKKN